MVETMGFEPTTPCLQTVRRPVVIAAELAPSGCGAAPVDRSRPKRVAHVWPETVLVIRRLVRAVRRGSCEAVPQVERPQQSATSRWRPTSWVHDGYTARAGIISLGTGPPATGTTCGLRPVVLRLAPSGLRRLDAVAHGAWRSGLSIGI